MQLVLAAATKVYICSLVFSLSELLKWVTGVLTPLVRMVNQASGGLTGNRELNTENCIMRHSAICTSFIMLLL